MARTGESGRDRRAGKSLRARSNPALAAQQTQNSSGATSAPRALPPPPLDPPPDTDFFSPPPTPDALHAWILRVLDVRLARTPLIQGHAAPFDYIVHTFFEGALGASNPAHRPSDCLVWANRGGGKTFLGALATLLDLIFKPRIQVRILAGSLEQARRMHDHLRSFVLSEKLEPLRARVTSRRVVLASGSCAEILAASQTSVRGTRVQKIRCDEVDLFDPNVWDAAQLVTRSMPCPGPWGDRIPGSVEALSTMHKPFGLMWKLVGAPAGRPTTPDTLVSPSAPGPAANPASSGVPLFRWGLLDVLEHCTDEHLCASCPLEPECQGRAKSLIAPGAGGHIPVADAAAMKRRVGRRTWDSEMLCLRPSRSSTVYPEFDAGVHVIDETTGVEFRRFLGGMDFGFRSECVCLLAGETRDGRLIVLREHCRRETRVRDMLGAFARWIDQGVCAAPGTGAGSLEWIAIDPAGLSKSDQTGRSNFEIIKELGLQPKWRKSNIQTGVNAIRARLAPACNIAHPEPSASCGPGEPPANCLRARAPHPACSSTATAPA